MGLVTEMHGSDVLKVKDREQINQKDAVGKITNEWS